MKVKELKGNLFKELHSMNDEFNFETERMNRLFMIKYSERILQKPLDEWTVNQIADILTFEFWDKWDLLISELQGLALGKTVKVTQETDKTENRKGVNDMVNSVTAFDSDDLLKNDGTNSVNTDDLKGVENKTVLTEYTDFETANKALFIKAENNIIDIILQDIAKFISLDIF